MNPFRILILSDGRPGHFNLSDGIAAAVERLGPSVTVRHDVRRGRWPGAVAAALTRSRLPSRAMLTSVYDIPEAEFPACDLIVSAGAETLAANVWLARSRGVPNIFYGSLRLFQPCDFTLVLTSYARNANLPRHALALKPSRLDPDSLGPPPPTPDFAKPTTLGLLVGGDAGAIRYEREDWNGLIELMSATTRQNGVRWLVANSRRTPTHFSDAVAHLAREVESPITRFLDVKTAGPGTLPQILEASAAVLCTADSSSMLSECIWARRPAVAIAPNRCPLTPDEAAYRSWLRNSRWCAEVSIRTVTPDLLQSAIAGIVPCSNNPQMELAALLSDRIRIGGAQAAHNNSTPHRTMRGR